eukprot:CAMPEP_0182438702 /NCGR_PEP_ID=MMETSP1167-20130531/85964_1 /TAXON_ID=2988 /ORGANISM="Mallomonas Sp, Strain CCMP3275" /LENGTH=495 /DNA_ID=CAMNT_0024632193 /DNA_START=1112 /DNA_END=2599 /DNA_ORIENTATION=+
MGLLLLRDEGMKEGLSSTVMDTVGDVKKACDTAVNVLNELLTFDKLEGGTLMLERTDVNAMRLIKETVSAFQIQARSSDITLNIIPIAFDEEALRNLIIVVDKHKIAQVIRNLVSNGLKFTPKFGVVTVRIDLMEEELREKIQTVLKIEVTDSGAGISPENQARLFKEIVQFNPGKLQGGGGSGLGLYISHGITNLHHGKLSVWSEGEGKGSTFSLVLPANIESSESKIDTSLSGFVYAAQLSGFGRTYAPSFACSPSAARSDSHASSEADDFSAQESIHNMKCKRKGAVVYLRQDEFEKSLRRSVRRASINLPRPSKILPVDIAVALNEDEKSDRDMPLRSPPTVMNGSCTSVVEKIISSDLNTTNITVLVVDDSTINRKMQCRLLKKRFKSCIEAEHGQEAVEKITESMKGITDEILLVVMDSQMPVMNGLEASKKMREIGFKGSIIGLTGNVSEEDVKSFLHHGANAVLPKPLELESFDLAVRQLFHNTSLD